MVKVDVRSGEGKVNNQKVVYQMKLKGHLSNRWSSWFEGLTISNDEEGYTTLSGPIADQAALFGLLKKVRDMGMPLLSLNRIEEKK